MGELQFTGNGGLPGEDELGASGDTDGHAINYSDPIDYTDPHAVAFDHAYSFRYPDSV